MQEVACEFLQQIPKQPGGRLDLPPGASFNDNMNDDPKLRELLRDSLPDAPVPSHFGAEVWQRIQAHSDATQRSDARFFERLFGLLMRPAFATLLLLLAIGGAAGAASLRAADTNEQARAKLAERHVATLDPYARTVAMR